jgi:hypothetical protein
MSELAVSRLRELLEYDPETGELKWRATGPGRRLNRIAGGSDGHGYLQTRIDGSAYFNHRLAWMYIHGAFPNGVIDHIDGNPRNNSITNLRDVPHRQNLENQRTAPSSNKSTGLLGASKHKLGYMAKIQVARKQVYLGIYRTPELAHQAYVHAKRELHKGGML